ncbi:MAG: hypothetical protein UY90_C0092G0003 [Candidatus Peregrinibacteria bacterium GW2011_GWA2_54_9]|nr:MAG: hypothetical protein UY90_C0092G0003 [Candidatus Peregrinibacteria bacterium GW2011_GWA2_54_9]
MFHPSGFFHPTPQEATGVSPWRNAGEAAKPEGRSGLPLRRVLALQAAMYNHPTFS